MLSLLAATAIAAPALAADDFKAGDFMVRARALGVSSAQLALFLRGSLSGTPLLNTAIQIDPYRLCAALRKGGGPLTPAVVMPRTSGCVRVPDPRFITFHRSSFGWTWTSSKMTRSKLRFFQLPNCSLFEEAI